MKDRERLRRVVRVWKKVVKSRRRSRELCRYWDERMKERARLNEAVGRINDRIRDRQERLWFWGGVLMKVGFLVFLVGYIWKCCVEM